MRRIEKEQRSYEDIMDLPYRKSTRHPHMPMSERAAQFSPFAALTGYDDEIEETARRTQPKRILTEEMKESLNQKLIRIKEGDLSGKDITISYFLPDLLKEGGSYQRERVSVRKVDDFDGKLILWDGRRIPFEDIEAIEE